MPILISYGLKAVIYPLHIPRKKLFLLYQFSGMNSSALNSKSLIFSKNFIGGNTL